MDIMDISVLNSIIYGRLYIKHSTWHKIIKKISSLLNKTLLRPTMQWLHFAKEEFKNAINKCNNLSFLEPDYIS